MQKYKDCMGMDRQKLESLFNEEIATWNNNIKRAQKNADNFKDKIREFLNEAEQKIQQLADPLNIMCQK